MMSLLSSHNLTRSAGAIVHLKSRLYDGAPRQVLSSAAVLHALIAPAQRITRLQDSEPHTLALPTRALSKVAGRVDTPPDDTV